MSGACANVLVGPAGRRPARGLAAVPSIVPGGRPVRSRGECRRLAIRSRAEADEDFRPHSAAVACSRFGAPCVSGILSA
jgi:hypothetical protein